MTLYNPSANAEIGEINEVRIIYYDNETHMNDAYYTTVTLNGTQNINRKHSMPIGYVNTLYITSYKGPGML